MKLVLFIAGMLLLGCNQTAKEEDAITRLINDLIAADNRSDIESILSHYTLDATLMPPRRPSISGIENLRETYQNIFATTRLQLQSKVEGVDVHGFSALAWGSNTGEAVSLRDSSVRSINDKYIAHLIKENGEWKILRLIWNAN